MSIRFKTDTLNIFKIIKEKGDPFVIRIEDKGKVVAYLRPVTKSSINNKKEIELLAKWRKENSFAFPSQFKVTIEGTKKWIEQLILNPTRILFFVESSEADGRIIGHLGLYSFNFDKDTCEIDNVVRGEKKLLKGAMTLAMKTMIKWVKLVLKPKNIYLRVFSDNEKAIRFYDSNGFKKHSLISLQKETKNGFISWSENIKLFAADKYFLKMIYKRI